MQGVGVPSHQTTSHRYLTYPPSKASRPKKKPPPPPPPPPLPLRVPYSLCRHKVWIEPRSQQRTLWHRSHPLAILFDEVFAVCHVVLCRDTTLRQVLWTHTFLANIHLYSGAAVPRLKVWVWTDKGLAVLLLNEAIRRTAINQRAVDADAHLLIQASRRHPHPCCPRKGRNTSSLPAPSHHAPQRQRLPLDRKTLHSTHGPQQNDAS
mmetsp:Transcript_37411/g.73127  ORF Transcript_37411/g.73127 Transcript_37411/m.73127 type:complete len:207 (+) Transcript_37411:111-731(+)